MSGISGIIKHHDNSFDLRSEKERLFSSIQHRGAVLSPEAVFDRAIFQGRYHPSSIYQVNIAVNRHVMAMVDGTIANEESLSGKLRTSMGNIADLILALYQIEGIEGLKLLQGTFVIAIYDTTTNQVFLYRDLFGARPMYYACQNGNLWLSSEVKGILSAPIFERSVNRKILPQELTFRANFGPETLFKDIYKVPPGYCCFGSPHKPLHIQLHTDFSFPQKNKKSSEEYQLRIWSLLGDSIAKKLWLKKAKTARTGILLSGGIDSALVLKKQEELSIHDRQVICCGFGDKDAQDMDETDIARSVATACSTPFNSVTTGSGDNLLQSLRNIVYTLEEPSRTVISIPIERALAQVNNFDCLLTGALADLLFGEAGHYDTPIATFRRKAPKFVLHTIRTVLPLLKKIPKLRGYANWFERGDQKTLKDYILAHERFNGSLCGLLSPFEQSKCALHIDALTASLSKAHCEDEYTITSIMMYDYGWNELFEKLASVHSIEVAHPFQCLDLLQLSLEMPYRDKISRHHTKPTLRKIAARLFSPDFAYADKKIFTSPAAIWLKDNDELRQFALNLKNKNARLHSYLNPDAIVKVVEDYEGQLSNNNISNPVAQMIYTLINVELWLETFFD